jgi:Zn-dependent protease
MQAIDGIFYVVILIMSVVVHEFAHGYVAYLCGDNTARISGRLTLNPLKHLDLFGSVILPLILILSKAGFVIGWARPVPYNPNNLKNGKRGEVLVAVSGILANLTIAVLFGLLMRFATSFGLPAFNPDPLLMHPFYNITSIIVLTNLVLALFNIIPIPPLDGSKILFAFIPVQLRSLQNFLERWGMFILILFIFFVWSGLSPLIYIAFSLITGIY